MSLCARVRLCYGWCWHFLSGIPSCLPHGRLQSYPPLSCSCLCAISPRTSCAQSSLCSHGSLPRFTARFDPSTGLYLALTNPSIDRYGANPDARNTLALVFSRDLLSWRVAATLLVANDGLPWDDSLWRTAYQYPGEGCWVRLVLALGGAPAGSWLCCSCQQPFGRQANWVFEGTPRCRWPCTAMHTVATCLVF